MGEISTARFILQMDSIAAQKQILDVACTKAAGTPDADTAAKGASNNYDRIDAYTDHAAELQLLGPAQSCLDIANADAQAGFQFRPLVLELNRNVSGIDRYCQVNAIRIAPAAKYAVEGCGFPTLSYLSVFSPTVDPIASYVIGGAPYTHGTAMDVSKYAPQQLTLYTVGAVGIADATYHVTCKKADGTTQVKDVAVPNGTGGGVEFPIGAGSDKYYDVTLITVTGGTAADHVAVRANTERVIDATDL